ncbi:MAG TPA: protein kinase [Blastocatellia bacterium]|nr:protein kinase [Blastocatellia bacterium]
MPFTPGSTLGHYKILERIGAGGMGEIYKAIDTRLERPVALKILPADLVTDADRVRRFIGEAKAASALNHPHIITIYGIGEAKLDSENPQGVGVAHYIAMEYISGATMHDKIHCENLDPKKLLEYLAQTADGLAKAHAAGIVHRDLKPENIMVTEDGYAKILDFGVAKLIEPDEPSARANVDPNEAPTAVMDRTRPGVVMGTIGYMSPEQAQGKVVDQRSDIFSFGCILYEAATRSKPFQGDSVIDSLHKIVYGQAPPIANTNPDAPAELQRIIRKCLAKDPAERYQSIRDVAIDLRDLIEDYDSQPRLSVMYGPQPVPSQGHQAVTALHSAQLAMTEGKTIVTDPSRAVTTGPESGITQPAKRPGGRFLMLAGAALLAILAAAAIYFLVSQKQSRATGPAFQNTTISKLTTTGRAQGAVISPDGKYVVHIVNEAGKQGLWVRQTATSSNVQIVAPDDGSYVGLTFSRDGNYVYFVKGPKGGSIRSLYQVPVLGGTPRKLIEDVDSAVTFSRDGKRFAFVRHSPSESALILVNSDGSGEQKLLTYKQPDVFLQAEWSPGDTVIVASTRKVSGGFRFELVAVQTSDGSEKVLGSQKWLAIGGLGWLTDGSGLVISAVDQTPGARQLQLWQITYPEGIAKRITNDLNNYSGVSVASDTLVTVQADAVANLWVAPDGDAARARQITSGSGRYDQISLAPDGRLLYISDASGTADVWLMDADGKNQRQLTSDAGLNVFPAPSPDGRSVVFCSNRGANPVTYNVWRAGIDGSNPRQLTSGEGEYLPVCSPDNKWVVYSSITIGGRLSLWKIPVDGGDPAQILDRVAVKAVISPDGKWIAFQTSGDQPGSGPKLGIMPFEGGQPLKLLDVKLTQYRWSADSKSILYIDDTEGVSNIWSQAVDGGPPKQLTKFTTDQIFSFDWSRDGKIMACSRGVVTTDVVLMRDKGREQ